MDFLEPISRPQGAEAAEAQYTTALHASRQSRQSRIHDFWYDPKYFYDVSRETGQPLELVLERNVDEPTAGELENMLHAAMFAKGIFIKPTRHGDSTKLDKVRDLKGGFIIINAHFSQRVHNGLFGELEKKSAYAATADDQNVRTQIRPARQTPMVVSEVVNEYSFSLEDVYGMVIPTTEDNIDEIIFKTEKDGEEMESREELSDFKTVDVVLSDENHKMKELALALRYSEKFARNNQRLMAVDMWVDNVIIRGRNAIRNEGIRKAAKGLTATALTQAAGTLKQLREMDFYFLDKYRNTLLVMSLHQFLTYDQPLAPVSATTQALDTPRESTLVRQPTVNLLNQLSDTTRVGVVDEGIISGTNTDILQIATDFCMWLFTYTRGFYVTMSYNDDNDSYRTKVQVEYVPIFRNRDARVLHDTTP